MCDAWQNLPAPGSPLFMHDASDPPKEVGDEFDVPCGTLGTLRVRVTKAKPSVIPGKMALNVEAM